MTLSIILNLFLALTGLGAVAVQIKRFSPGATLKFFTSLSNVLCSVSALVIAICYLSGHVPAAVSILKYAGTAAVTVTLLTVLIFLGPAAGYKAMLSGPDLWLHLICPVTAIVTWALFDHIAMPFACIIFGWLPVILYGLVYLKMVVFPSGENKWDDFYGFNKGGKWPVSFALMYLGGLIVSIVLWMI